MSSTFFWERLQPRSGLKALLHRKTRCLLSKLPSDVRRKRERAVGPDLLARHEVAVVVRLGLLLGGRTVLRVATLGRAFRSRALPSLFPERRFRILRLL